MDFVRFSVLKIFTVCLCLSFILLPMADAEDLSQYFNPASGKAVFVSQETGKNSNPGTKEQPVKNIDKAMKTVQSGDTIIVAEGIYMGTFNVGYLECDKAVKLYGGFSTDFSVRDIINHPTVFQPDNASGAKSRKAMLKFTKEIAGVVVDGFVFDMGERNSYSPDEGKPDNVATGMLLLPPSKAPGQNATVTEPILSVPSAAQGGDILIQNNVFVNGSNFGIQMGIREGTCRILNNVFVANRMAAVEVYGTCPNRGGPNSLPKCGSVEFAYNTVLFTWSRLKDFLDMGYGFRVMTKLDYNIHHNIFGGNILGGIDHTRFNNSEWVKIDFNIFFVNKKSDLWYSPASNTSLDLRAEQFEDLEIASAQGNKGEIPAGIKVDPGYLEGFLNARYSEQADFDRNSPANQWRSILGMNLQGKLTTQVSMFANRYSWKKALELFGAVSSCGAQAVK
jgi:hypothetical protein